MTTRTNYICVILCCFVSSAIFVAANCQAQVVVRDAFCDSDNIHIKLYNTERDTLFLFSSYFQVESPCLFRYDPKRDVFIYSLLPLVHYLSYNMPNDLIRFNAFRPIIEDQITYSFVNLPPGKQLEVTLSTRSMRYGYYFDDIAPYSQSIECSSVFSLHPMIIKPSSIDIKLAIYKNVDFFNHKYNRPLSVNEINGFVLNYDVITTTINTKMIDFKNPVSYPNIKGWSKP